MLKKILASFVLSASLFSCSDPASEEIGYGVIENGVYKNSYFNMQIETPANWSIQSRAAQDKMLELGSDLISGDDANLKQLIKASEKQTVSLFSFMKHELGAPVEFNPNIAAAAERVTHMPGLKRGSDYNYHVRKILEQSNVSYSFDTKEYSVDFDNVTFDVMPASIAISGMDIYQQYYATKIKDHVLGFVLTYTTPAEKVELQSILDTIRFSINEPSN